MDENALRASAALVARARAGEIEAREELLRLWLGAAEGSIRRSWPRALRQRESVSDTLQSFVLRIRPKLGRPVFEDLASICGWFRRCLKRQVRDRLRYCRAAKRDLRREAELDHELVATGSSVSSQVGRREMSERLRQALCTLPSDQRRVVELHHLEGLPFSEIARLLGRSEGACRNLKMRALAAIAKRLA
jgi:RNA polymerase sigma-70 factor (ECF subfamily)